MATSVDNSAREGGGAPAEPPPTVCPHFHAAVELIGRRWVGAILVTLLQGPLFFSELASAVPKMSDRLLSQRLRELEAAGLVERSVHDGPPARVSYALTEVGRELEPAIHELRDWAQRWEAATEGAARTPGS